MTHTCVSKLTIIGSDNGLSPDRRQAIIWTNAGLFVNWTLKTNFSEILIEILTFSFKKMRLKVSSAKRRPFFLGLNVLNVGWAHTQNPGLAVEIPQWWTKPRILSFVQKWHAKRIVLTQCGPVTSDADMDLGQHRRRRYCLMAPSNWLNQCWLITKGALWHSPESNFTKMWPKTYSENNSLKLTTTSTYHGRWVNVFPWKQEHYHGRCTEM